MRSLRATSSPALPRAPGCPLLGRDHPVSTPRAEKSRTGRDRSGKVVGISTSKVVDISTSRAQEEPVNGRPTVALGTTHFSRAGGAGSTT